MGECIRARAPAAGSGGSAAAATRANGRAPPAAGALAVRTWQECTARTCNWIECILGAGLYAPQLRHWLDHFGRESRLTSPTHLPTCHPFHDLLAPIRSPMLSPIRSPSLTSSHLLPPSPTSSHLLPPPPTSSHLLPPPPTFSHLLPPSPTFSQVRRGSSCSRRSSCLPSPLGSPPPSPPSSASPSRSRPRPSSRLRPTTRAIPPSLGTRSGAPYAPSTTRIPRTCAISLNSSPPPGASGPRRDGSLRADRKRAWQRGHGRVKGPEAMYVCPWVGHG